MGRFKDKHRINKLKQTRCSVFKYLFKGIAIFKKICDFLHFYFQLLINALQFELFFGQLIRVAFVYFVANRGRENKSYKVLASHILDILAFSVFNMALL